MSLFPHKCFWTLRSSQTLVKYFSALDTIKLLLTSLPWEQLGIVPPPANYFTIQHSRRNNTLPAFRENQRQKRHEIKRIGVNTHVPKCNFSLSTEAKACSYAVTRLPSSCCDSGHYFVFMPSSSHSFPQTKQKKLGSVNSQDIRSGLIKYQSEDSFRLEPSRGHLEILLWLLYNSLLIWIKCFILCWWPTWRFGW